jgi:hypothetical protein
MCGFVWLLPAWYVRTKSNISRDHAMCGLYGYFRSRGASRPAPPLAAPSHRSRSPTPAALAHLRYPATPAINEGCTRSLRISHTSRRAPLQPVSKTQVPCTPYHPPTIAGVDQATRGDWRCVAIHHHCTHHIPVYHLRE